MKGVASAWLTVRTLQSIITFQVLFCTLILIWFYHGNSDCIMGSQISEREECGIAGHQAPKLILSKEILISQYHVNTVEEVFTRVGYRKLPHIESEADWDFLWTSTYPFYPAANRRRTTPQTYQKVNHIPGMTLITSTDTLVQDGGKFIPLGFRMPQDKDRFNEEAQKTKTQLWIQKHVAQSGNEVNAVKEIHDLDLDAPSLIQEFIKNPLLIDGYKFSVGVYVLLTSVDPLRAYILDSAMEHRFCGKKYSLDNLTDVTTYMTDIDESIPIDKIPCLEKFFKKLAYSSISTLETYIHLLGKNYRVFHKQLYDAIRDVLTTRLYRMKQYIPASLVDRKNLFFELTKWDFVVDEDLKLHLIKVNMSPDFSANLLNMNEVRLKERVIFYCLRLAGVTDKHRHRAGSSCVDSVRDSDINAGIAICSSTECASCQTKECFVCTHCMSTKNKYLIKLAFAEHINQHNMRRVYPEEMTQDEAINYDISNDENQTFSERLTRAWYRAKCIGNPDWCQ